MSRRFTNIANAAPDETPEAYGERLARELDSQDRGTGRRERHRLHRRNGGRRHPGRGPGGAGLFQARARDLRPPRNPADPRRSDVRHGPHRHAACLRAGRRQPRHSLPSPRDWAAAMRRSARCCCRTRSSRPSPKAPGAFQHSHTYTGHPLACAAALAVQRVIRRDNLLANVRKQGAHLARRLQERFGNHPFVGDVRGRGLFQGLETRGRPRHQGTRSIRSANCMRGSSAKRWRAG